MNIIRALIVDDERLARLELRRLLAAHPEIEVAAEAANASEAQRQLDALAPDLLFLDIQMPGTDGFALLAAMDRVPPVIFTTAYDDFALRAFEVNALDYLLKPIDPARLADAVARAAGRIAALAKLRDADASRADVSVADAAVTAPHDGDDADHSAPLGESDRIFIRDGERCWFVEMRDVVLLESEGNYTRVHFNGHRPLVARALGALESRLDPRTFFRANRSQIVNLRHVLSMEPSLAGGLALRMSAGIAVEMSRRQSQRLREQTRL